MHVTAQSSRVHCRAVVRLWRLSDFIRRYHKKVYVYTGVIPEKHQQSPTVHRGKNTDKITYRTNNIICRHSAFCSFMTSFSLSFIFSAASRGNQSSIKFSKAQSTFSECQFMTVISKTCWASKETIKNALAFASKTLGALHMGQLPSPFLCIFTRHLAQNKWVQLRRIGLKAMLVQIAQV